MHTSPDAPSTSHAHYPTKFSDTTLACSPNVWFLILGLFLHRFVIGSNPNMFLIWSVPLWTSTHTLCVMLRVEDHAWWLCFCNCRRLICVSLLRRRDVDWYLHQTWWRDFVGLGVCDYHSCISVLFLFVVLKFNDWSGFTARGLCEYWSTYLTSDRPRMQDWALV